MSKVKFESDEFNGTRQKAKMKHSLRRKETEHIKQKRMQKAKELPYSYRYYVVDSKPIRKIEKIEVPEYVKKITHLRPTEKYITLEDGQVIVHRVFKEVVDDVKVIPAHILKRRCIVGYEDIKPYLRGNAPRKKWLKRQASRKVRKAGLYVGNGGVYKKYYDIRWALY